jgi:diadenosine tetraphosphate (Ap4A) HIT family hydrolase
MSFNLDPRLESSSFLIQDLPLCQLRLKNDSRFPWVMLIPRRHAIVELFDLSEEDQHQLWIETVATSRMIHQLTSAHKMNMEALGNKVSQLHIHIIARHEEDAAWPESVLGCAGALEYTPEAARQVISKITTYFTEKKR